MQQRSGKDNLIRLIIVNLKKRESLIWANYLYGHKFIFKKYRDIPFENFKANRWFKLLEYLPIKIMYSSSGFYRGALARYPVVAQSFWTLLLLERVYNLRAIGLLKIPVEESIYPCKTIRRIGPLYTLGTWGSVEIL